MAATMANLCSTMHLQETIAMDITLLHRNYTHLYSHPHEHMWGHSPCFMWSPGSMLALLYTLVVCLLYTLMHTVAVHIWWWLYKDNTQDVLKASTKANGAYISWDGNSLRCFAVQIHCNVVCIVYVKWIGVHEVEQCTDWCTCAFITTGSNGAYWWNKGMRQ